MVAALQTAEYNFVDYKMDSSVNGETIDKGAPKDLKVTHLTTIGYIKLNAYIIDSLGRGSSFNLVARVVTPQESSLLDTHSAIIQENQKLKHQLKHAQARLRLAKRNLRALDNAKDEFISMTSHQLRTPLTTITGYISMILEGDAGHINHQEREFLGYAYAGAERMVALISDLLNVSRLSAGRFIIEKKPTDLGLVLADEVRQLRSHAMAKHLDLRLLLPKRKLPRIGLDEGKTRQVIMNFIDNAIYYTKEGSVVVSLECDDTHAIVKVSDTGIGVPEAAKQKLFTKFYRATNAQKTRPDGTGLGLYLAKRVVEDQGGSVIFESQENVGSTFGFSIPLGIAKRSKVKHDSRKDLKKPA